MARDHGRHIYGILEMEGDTRLERIVLGDSEGEVEAVRYRDIAAAVGRAPPTEYKALDKQTLVRCLMVHQRVLEQLLTHHTVIPVKFGTVVENREMERILETGYTDMRRALDASRGQVEFEVVGTWEVGAVLAAIAGEPAIQKIKAEVEAMPALARLKGQIEAGKAVKERLDERKQEMQDQLEGELRARLAGCADRLRVNETMDDSMVLNVAVLVPADHETAFEAALHALDDSHANEINFRCIGPLPPYSFMTVEVRRADFRAIVRAKKALGLRDEARLSEVREAYDRLAAQCHPDRRPDDERAAQRFQELTAAWQALAAYCDGEGDPSRTYSFRRKDVERFLRVAVVEPGSDLVESSSVALG